jgi:Protein of unknown function (DUF2975)
MASVTGTLPTIFRWVFTVLAALCAFAAFVICVAILINPHLPAGTTVGPADGDFMGQPGSIDFHPAGGDFDLMATAFRGTITLFVRQAGGLIEVIKHYGLPVILIQMVFLTALFELLRRLFRNVGRGESFSQDTVRLVQILGGTLIVFSFVLSAVEGLFVMAVFTYFSQHAVITISGAPIHWPAQAMLSHHHGLYLPRGDGFPFGSPMFFSGLLVLALSEVFRQGVALKKENELTI